MLCARPQAARLRPGPRCERIEKARAHGLAPWRVLRVAGQNEQAIKGLGLKV